MSKQKKPDRSSRAYYQYRQKRTRLVASILAIVLALAMFFAYVIEAGLFANLGGAPPAEETEGGAFLVLQSAADAAFAEDSAASQDADQTADTAPPAAEDEENAAAALELSSSDLAAAAATLNKIGDLTLYESTLRAILNARYESGASNEDLAPFVSGLDARGTVISSRYARAYEERAAGFDNGYIPAELLVTAEDAQTAAATIPEGMGTVTDTVETGNSVTVVVALSTEWSAKDAAAALAEDPSVHAQPNYLYFTQTEPAEAGSGEEDTAIPVQTEQPAEQPAVPSPEDNPGSKADTEDAAPADQETDASAEQGTTAEDTAPAEQELAAPAAAPSDLAGLFQYAGTGKLDLTACWNLLATDHDTVRVGVLDTGVYIEHEDLDDVLARDDVTHELISGMYTSSGGRIIPGEISDGDGTTHGTHVCGIIAAEANGVGMAGMTAGYSEQRALAGTSVTPVAELVVVCGYILLPSQSKPVFTTLSLTRGIDYLTETGCRIINLSLGGNISYEDLPVLDSLKAASDKGVLVIAAAGNKSSSEGNIPPFYCYPGWYPYTIGVINAAGPGSRYSSSNYGPDYDIAAPGTSLYSTTHIAVKDKEGNITGYTDYGTKSGTSMAAPVITGLAAMMLYQDPSLTSREVRNILYATAGNQLAETPTAGTVNTKTAFEGSPEQRGNMLGFGYVNPAAALTAVNSRLSGSTAADYMELNRTDITMYRGDQTTLEYRLLPATAKLPAKGIEWVSSNESIATVDKDGIVTAVGRGSCTITGTCRGAGEGGSDISASTNVTVNTIDLSNAEVTGIKDDMTYTGEPLTQLFTVEVDGVQLRENTDYTVTYNANTMPGTATITITGIKKYEGTVTRAFTIILPKHAKEFVLGGNTLRFKKNTYTGIRLPSVARPYQLSLTARVDKSMLLQWTDCKKLGADIDGYIILRRVDSETGYTEYTTTAATRNYYYDKSITKANTNYYYLVLGYKTDQFGNRTVSSDSMSVVGIRYDSRKINPHEVPVKNPTAAIKAKYGLPVINKKTATISCGGTVNLSLSYPSLAFSTWTRWRSDNSAIATVNSKGVVTGRSPGTVLISGRTPNGRDIRCTVIVK